MRRYVGDRYIMVRVKGTTKKSSKKRRTGKVLSFAVFRFLIYSIPFLILFIISVALIINYWKWIMNH